MLGLVSYPYTTPREPIMANIVWTEAHKEFIRQNAGRMKDWEIATTLSRLLGRTISLSAVRTTRQRLGIRKRRGRGLCEVTSRTDPAATIGLTIQS